MNIQSNHPGAILILAASLFLASCAREKEQALKKEKPVSVRVGIPARQSGEKITASGQIESKESAAISTRMMGFVSSIKVKPGDAVQKGQLLVTISNGEILAKRAQAQAMVSEADAALKDAQKDYERFEQLYKQESASAKEFENATLHFNSVKAKAEAALQMRNEADSWLAYADLVAPFSGVVTQKNMDEGSMASPGMPILRIEKSHDYQVRASVSESEIGRLMTGLNAEVTVKSTGKRFTGKLSEISPSSQFSGGQFEIKITVPAMEKTGLLSGMYVSVNIPFAKSKGGPLVPASAIVHRDQLSGLYTVSDDQRAQLRWVKVGKKFGDEIEILSGLRLGEKFIIQSEGRLYSGVAVTVRNIIYAYGDMHESSVITFE